MKGVHFGNKHSFDDWGLMLKQRPVVSPPVPKTLYVDVPGADGQLDLTEALTDEVKYNMRKITLTFVVIEARESWSDLYSEIQNTIHGKSLRIILDEDRAFYYEGRCQVKEWKSDKKTSTITIEANVKPYKIAIDGSGKSL